MAGYLAVLLCFGVAAIIVGVLTNVSALLGPRRRTAVKAEAFECGNPPSGSARSRFAVKFYLVAILFIVFDVEVVFLYPWAVLFRDLGLFGLVEVAIFIGLLGVGFVYVWKRGALLWQ